MAGIERHAGSVRALNGDPIDADIAYRYKLAIRDMFGPGAYAMTKVNFTLAGCLCRACRFEND